MACLAVFAAFAARAALVLWHPAPPDGDERTYMALAENLARHGRFSVDSHGPLEAHYGPLYTLLQAALILCGLSSLHAGWTVSLLAGSLAGGLVYRLGLQVWGRPAAAAAAAAATVLHPALLDASRLVYTETLSSLFLLLAVACLGLPQRPGILAGIALGLAALTRRESAFLVPVFAASFFWDALPFPPAGPRRDRLRQVAALLLSFFLVFAPYVAYLRHATGHWTLSNRANFAWIVGRLMQERPGRGVDARELQELEARYPTPLDWLLARPWETTRQLAEAAVFHLRQAFFPARSWPIGILAMVGLGSALAFRRLRLWPPPAALLPFLLVLPWAMAGPILRYSRGIVPFVCLLVGALLSVAGKTSTGLKPAP